MTTIPDPRRLRAWETRRSKYGPRGHSGPYRVFVDAVGERRPSQRDTAVRALAFILDLHAKGELSEGQCCKALGLDRVSFRELADRQ